MKMYNDVNVSSRINDRLEGTQSLKEATLSFDDFLKCNKNQAEFDRRVQKAINTAHKKWTIKNDPNITEIERLDKMNEPEKLEYYLKQQQHENLKIQKKLNSKYLKDKAIRIASSKDSGFDIEFLDLFDFENLSDEELIQKTKILKSVQDRIVQNIINFKSK